ncbi:MAG: carboxypeptidase-like regulatory domain-containing protein, partial [Bacteroidota bacterium]
NLKTLTLLSTLLCLTFFACNKEGITPFPSSPTSSILENFTPKVEEVTASVSGFVVDDNGDPVSNALVRLNNNSLTTDEYGHFFLEDLTMNSRGTVVRVEKGGFFKGSRRFFPVAAQQNRLTIQLLKKSFDQSFSSSTGGQISLPSGATIDFEADGIQRADGGAFSGTVQVAAQWMDPTQSATMDQMPGNLQGVNAQSEEVSLATFGMMAVELQDENGALLNIANGSSAQLTMPVPASLQEDAPEEIPLWSYDEDYGLWVEESVATLKNGAYVGDVTHFSFWNCDHPFPVVEFSLKLIDESAVGVTNTLVTIEVLKFGTSIGSGYTDEQGMLTGLIPANEPLILRVFNVCGEELYTQTIGPFSDKVDLGNIPIFDTQENLTKISGTLECNGAPSTSGLLIVEFDGQTLYHYIEEGTFSFSFTTCETTTSVNVRTIDFTDGSQSDESTVNAGVATNLGVIQTCVVTVDNYLRLNIDGEEAFYANATSYSGLVWTSVEVALGPTEGFINIGFDGKEVGDYGGSENSINMIADESRGWFFDDETPMDNFEVTEYGAIGEPIRG